MITTVKPGVTPTTRAAAENHMRDSIYKLFAKSYAGTYGGVSSGVWNFAINAKDGSVTGTYTDADKSSGPISGQMSTDMSVSSTYGFTGIAGSNTWNGTLNVSTGVFNGTWDGGTFTGKVATPPATTKPTTTGITPNTGAVSSSVTITGTNLTSVTQVLFSLTSNINTFSAGTITAQTATGITATVPSTLAAGNYTVTVVHSGGEVMVGAFTVTAASVGSTGLTFSPAFGGISTFANSAPMVVSSILLYSQNSFQQQFSVTYTPTSGSVPEGLTISATVASNGSGQVANVNQITTANNMSPSCVLSAHSLLPLCSKAGIAFNRSTGNLSFTNTPMAINVGSTSPQPTAFTVNGSLTFTPF
jgi:hypothetical protein